MEERAQISVELIIVLAAVIAVAIVLVSQLQKTAEKGAKSLGDKSDDVFKQIDKIN